MLDYLMYLWLNPVVFLVLLCRGSFSWCWGCSSLFPAPPSWCLAGSPCGPSEVPCALGIVTKAFSSLAAASRGWVWWEQLLKSLQAVGVRVKFSPRVSRRSWNPWDALSPVSYTGNHRLETKPAFPKKAATVQTAALDLLSILHLYLIPVLYVKIGMS